MIHFCKIKRKDKSVNAKIDTFNDQIRDQGSYLILN